MGLRFPYSSEPDEVLLQRADELHAPLADVFPKRYSFISIVVSGVTFLIPSESVVGVIERRNAIGRGTRNASPDEVFQMLGILTVPGAAACILGVVLIQGELLTVFDLPLLLSGHTSSIPQRTQLIHVRTRSSACVFLSEQRPETVVLLDGDIRPSSDVLPQRYHKLAQRAARAQDTFLGILDVESILQHPHITKLLQ